MRGGSSKFAEELEFGLLGDAVEIAEGAHEGVLKAAVVGATFHLLSEDFSGVALAGDMEDVDGAVLNPFAGAVLAEFQMAGILHYGST